MVELTDEEINAALTRGRLARAHEPRAAAARFDGAAGLIVLELTNGCVFAFPPGSAQGLETASESALAAVEILGAGSGLHWDALDVDLSVPGLLAGIFGTTAYIARQAGRARSPAKAAAARANGAKGGRPRRVVGGG
jgi:hypothetical protein